MHLVLPQCAAPCGFSGKKGHNLSLAKSASKPSDKRVVLIAGNEDALRRDAFKALFKELGMDEKDPEAETIIADQRPPTEWTATAASVPFIAVRRVVVVRNLLRVDPAHVWEEKPKSKDHPLTKELLALPQTAMLVLVADDETGDDDKQSRLQSVAKRWLEIVTNADGCIVTFEANDKDLADKLRKIAKERGKQMTPASAALLAEMAGGSVSIALAELDKLTAFIGEAEVIHESDVRTVVAPEQEYNVYQLVDAVVAGDSGAALKQLRTLTSRNDKIEGQAFSRIFPNIGRQFRVIWQARLCLDANCRPSSPSPAVLAMFPARPRIDQEREWSQNRALRAARRLSLAQIRQVFSELSDADAKIKGLLPSFSTNEAVEEMVLRMSAACRGN